MDSEKVSKSFHITPQSEEIYNLSGIQNKSLILTIIGNFTPNLYYFYWLGYLQIKKIDIKLPLDIYWRKHGVYQTFLDLSNIKIGGKIVSLLASPSRRKNIKQHDIDLTLVKLTKEGIKVWRQAKKDGLWKILDKIPREFLRSPEEFSDYIQNHLFFDKESFQKRLDNSSNINKSTLLTPDNTVKPSYQHLGKIEYVDFEAISSKNIEKYEYRKQFSRRKESSVKKSKPRPLKRDITRTAIELPKITLRKIFIFTFNSKRFLQKLLEDHFLTGTEFERNVNKLGKRAKSYNLRRYSRFISGKLTLLKDRGLLIANYPRFNGNTRNDSQKKIFITRKGIQFFKYLRKQHPWAISGSLGQPFDLDQMLNRSKIHKVSRLLLRYVLYGIVGLIFAVCLSLLIVYCALQLEGILWTHQDNTVSTVNTLMLIKTFLVPYFHISIHLKG